MSSENDVSATPFHVEQHESLPEVLERLGAHRGETLTLVIADHSPILLTATEFRALKDLADRHRIQLQVQTADPLRLQLASMFGLARPQARPEPQHTPEDDGHHGFGSWRDVRRPRHRPAGQPPEEVPPDEPARAAETPDADPITVSRRRRNALYRDSVSRDREDDVVPISDAGLDYIGDGAGAGRSRAWLYGRIAAAALVALALVAAALWFWMPAVTVDITLREAEVSTDIVYSVTAPGADPPSDAAFAVEASEQAAEVPFRIEIPASGVEREPDGTASGTLLFRNAGEEAVTLEQGTELATIGGQAYVLLEAVEVPAGSVEEPGEAEAPVTAAAAGAAGNVPAGGLTGKVPDQPVFFSNLGGPIEGGSDREFAVVTEDDVAAAEAAVQEDLRAASVDGWRSQLPEGMSVVGPSVTPAEPQYTIEGAPGERRDAVVVSGTVAVTGFVYSIAEVEDQARASFEVALQEQVPPGYALVADTIRLGEPEVIAEAPQRVEYRVDAVATARAIFDEGAQDGLRDRMAGASAEEARAAVSSVGAIETWELSRSPGWWPDRMPQSADRITLQIRPGDAAGAPATPAAASTPEAAP